MEGDAGRRAGKRAVVDFEGNILVRMAGVRSRRGALQAVGSPQCVEN